MKHVKFLASICFAAGMSFAVSSCNSGGEKKADEKPGDTSAVATTAPAVPVKPGNMMVATMKVANYQKLLAVYEADDSARKANGLHSYVIARGVEDTNMIIIALKMDDTAKANSFASSPHLKAKMKESGVMGATISFLDVQFQDNSETTTSTRLIGTHKVKDYDTWKKVFDGDKSNRVNAGITDRLLAYDIGNNHQVSMVFIISDTKKAKEFFRSPEFKEKMKAGGVEDKQGFFLYTIAKKY